MVWGKNEIACKSINLQAIALDDFIVVIPSGLEPKSSEPESDILSIELRGQSGCKNTTFLRLFDPLSLFAFTLVSSCMRGVNKGFVCPFDL